MTTFNTGTYLAQRIHEAGAREFFCVPGDYNLILLDQLIKHPKLRMIGCCNELNAGYAADGYARETGFSVVVFTYMVGGLSIINAAAGAYSDDLPVLFISGGPNTNDAPANHRIHHTIGETSFYQASECFQPVVEKVFVIRHIDEAPTMIDAAIRTALSKKKPVYLEIACNLAGREVPPPAPIQLPPAPAPSDPKALAAALDALAERINGAVKPVLIGGVKLRRCEAAGEFLQLADVLGSAVATMPDAKELFPENHPAFMGTYWGEVSSPSCAEIVESSDCQIFAGPMFNDYTTTGWTTLNPDSKRIHLGEDFVQFEGAIFTGVQLRDVLAGLQQILKKNETSLQTYRRFFEEPAAPSAAPKDAALSIKELRRQVQEFLSPGDSLVIETGDSWFNGQKFHLPEGVRYHFQMQYGSIGWATGATLGVSLAAKAKGKGRTILMTGDGSFQMTAQELSTMIRNGCKPVIFLINNRGYTIEVEIHDGPYNVIKNWDYAGLVGVFNAEDGKGLGIRVNTAGELQTAVETAKAHDGPVLIECTIDKDDCTKELLEWGSRVAAANGRS